MVTQQVPKQRPETQHAPAVRTRTFSPCVNAPSPASNSRLCLLELRPRRTPGRRGPALGAAMCTRPAGRGQEVAEGRISIRGCNEALHSSSRAVLTGAHPTHQRIGSLPSLAARRDSLPNVPAQSVQLSCPSHAPVGLVGCCPAPLDFFGLLTATPSLPSSLLPPPAPPILAADWCLLRPGGRGGLVCTGGGSGRLVRPSLAQTGQNQSPCAAGGRLKGLTKRMPGGALGGAQYKTLEEGMCWAC